MPVPGRRPERTCTNSMASISTRSPFVPWLNFPPAGPSSTSSNGWPWIVRPLSHDVGHQTTVVVGGEVHPVPGRGTQVDAVGPHVAGEPDVEQVPETHPTDGRAERDRQVAHRRRRPPATGDGLRADGLQLDHDLVVGEVGTLADLELVHAVDPVVRIDLTVQRHAADELMDELREARLRVARAQHVQDHLAHVPRGAVGRSCPLVIGERRGERGEPPKLLLRDHLGLGSLDALDREVAHRLFLLLRVRVVQVQVDESVEVTSPAVTAGIVAGLGVEDPRDHGDEAVDVGGVGHAGGGEELAEPRATSPRRPRTPPATARSRGSAGGTAARIERRRPARSRRRRARTP